MNTLKVNIMSICIVLTFVTSCSSSHKQRTADQPASVDTSTEGDIEVGPTDVTYFKFKDFGTRMVIPEAWQYGVIINKGQAKDCDGCAAEYVATFASSSGKEKQFLGAIYVFTPKQWEAVPAEWKGIYIKVGEVNGNLYFYKSNQSNPYGNDSEIGMEYESHFIEMPNAPRIIVIEKLTE